MSENVKVAAKAPEAKRENSVSQQKTSDLSQLLNSPVDQILFLQRTIGNQVVARLIKSGAMQAKLRLGQPDDIYEQEADRVAEQVMRMPEPYMERYPTVMLPHRIPTALQRAETTPSPVETATQKPAQQSNRPPRPSDAGTQMSKLLEVVRKEATGQKGKCYAAMKRYISNAGGYGDILNINQDERFEGSRLYALQFTSAVENQGAANLGLEKVSGNPMNAEAGTILVLKGHKDLHISEAYGDISVIDSRQGSTLVCYNDGRMILPGPAAIWEGEGKYAATVAGMYKPVSRPALEAAPASSATATVQAPAVQLKHLPNREPTVLSSGRNDSSPDYIQSVIKNTLDTSGRPLNPQTLNFMEPRFGHDFSRVRVHADAKAAEAARTVNSLAFTVGQDVVFGKGKYEPDTSDGRRLLAHELTHVVQQENNSTEKGNFKDHMKGVVQRKVPEQSASHDGVFQIRSSEGSTIKRGTQVTYTVIQTHPTMIAEGSSYHYHWSVENDPATYAIYVKTNPDIKQLLEGPKDKINWTLYSVFPGIHLVKMKVLLNDVPVSNLVFEQTVTDDGRSLLHNEIIEMANQTKVDKDAKEWTTWDIVKWKFPKLGDPNYIFDFKKQWVRGYRDVIKSAAAEFDLPDILVGGVAYVEVGGDPLWIDDIAYEIRSFDHSADPLLEPLTITKEPEKTSVGNVSVQIRRAAETLGYEPEKLSDEQEEMIIESLKDPRQNIFIAAKHLAELRDIDFKGKHAGDMTIGDIKVTATRYNRGPDLSIEKIKSNLSYGEFIIKRFSELINLLSDEGNK